MHNYSTTIFSLSTRLLTNIILGINRRSTNALFNRSFNNFHPSSTNNTYCRNRPSDRPLRRRFLPLNIRILFRTGPNQAHGTEPSSSSKRTLHFPYRSPTVRVLYFLSTHVKRLLRHNLKTIPTTTMRHVNNNQIRFKRLLNRNNKFRVRIRNIQRVTQHRFAKHTSVRNSRYNLFNRLIRLAKQRNNQHTQKTNHRNRRRRSNSRRFAREGRNAP